MKKRFDLWHMLVIILVTVWAMLLYANRNISVISYSQGRQFAQVERDSLRKAANDWRYKCEVANDAWKFQRARADANSGKFSR